MKTVGDDPMQLLSPAEIVNTLELVLASAVEHDMHITADAVHDALDIAEDEKRYTIPEPHMMASIRPSLH